MRAIPVGIALVVAGFVLKSAGTQAGPADVGSEVVRPSMSVFGTIHPDIFRLPAATTGTRAPLPSATAATPAGSFQLASLDPQIGAGALLEEDTLADEPIEAAYGNASFAERFASFADPDSFADRFGSAVPTVTGSVRPVDRAIREASRPMGRLPEMAPAAPPAPKHVRPGQPRRDIVSTPEDDGRTAIYDITARTVYMPDGRKLEAHSGLGSLMDDPRHIRVRMQGPTPPNVYRLTMREKPFHGVRAIRLNPVDGSKMHGRAGMLAHPYMLGPNGQSNGCVSFNDYPAFLKAFEKGEVTRLVVVERLEAPPTGPAVASSSWLPDALKNLFKSSDDSGQYAAAH